ncbi:MAG TPA: recombinase RecQ, partial [Micromonosporaceae bacterium]|nr:recombinase RecQ [Micromonosporaceae bacterium]
GRLSDLGWGARLRALLGDASPDAPVPDDIFAGVVEVLRSWAHGDDRWPERPVGVVTIATRRRPVLVASLAERIGTVGRLPTLGEVSRVDSGPAPAGRSNSAQRVRALYGTFEVPAGLGALTGPVLLIDDYVDSGWTMALVARELRLAGAPAVLPFALAVAT